jgi:hypothetical protein
MNMNSYSRIVINHAVPFRRTGGGPGGFSCGLTGSAGVVPS